jgi:hypothetical protein
VYLPTAFPIIAPFAVLPWKAARLAWSLLSIAVFAYSAALLLRACKIEKTSARWLLAAGILFFSPTSSGLSTGNPSVVSCGLTLAAILLALRHRTVAAAIFLGLAQSIKPQISLAGLAVFLLWGYWRTIAFSFVVPIVAGLVSFLRVAQIGPYKLWLLSLREGIATSSLPGGINDPSPANYFSYHLINAAAVLSVWVRTPHIVSAVIWTGTVLVAVLFLLFRNRDGGGVHWPRDMAFFCTLSLVPVYHRYYDAQLLLGILPFLCSREGIAQKRNRAIWVTLLILLLPLQAMLADSHHGLNPATPIGFLLLRHQPLTVLAICLLLLPSTRGTRQGQGGQEWRSDATVCKS